MKHALMPVAVAATLALSGCGGSEASYDSVAKLEQAVASAGYACPSPTPVPSPNYAKESASCDGSTLLSVFDSGDKLKAQVDFLRTDSGLGKSDILVGSDWIVNASPDVLKMLQGKLGGDLKVGS